MTAADATHPSTLLAPRLIDDTLEMSVPLRRVQPPPAAWSIGAVFIGLVGLGLAMMLGSTAAIGVGLLFTTGAVFVLVLTVVATNRVVLRLSADALRIDHHTRVGRLWNESIPLANIRSATTTHAKRDSGAPPRLHIAHTDGNAWTDMGQVPAATATWLASEIDAVATRARLTRAPTNGTLRTWLSPETLSTLTQDP